MKKLLLPSAFLLTAISQANASSIFDDFNTDLGHFGFTVPFSATTVGEDPTSTNTRVVAGGTLEGGGMEQLHLVHDTSTTAFRLRNVSGGPPYNTSTGGAPSANVTFTTSSGTDGFIGFYVKTTATGWETSINLDGPDNTSAELFGSTSVAVNPDGQWHLYEWNLDASIWGTVPGIITQTTGPLANTSHSIDSIYFRDLDGSTGPTADIFVDFVAKSDSGSVAGLLAPEPSTLGLLGLAAWGLAGRRRRRAQG